MPTYDDRLAQLALKEGKVTLDHVANAHELVARMAELGVKRDLLGALVDREVLTSEEADRLRRLAAPAEVGGALGEPVEVPSAHVAFPPLEVAQAVEEAEVIGEAELVAATTAPGAAGALPPIGAPSAREAEPTEEAGALAERPSPGVKQVASGESWQAPCHRHPGRAALRKCKACGKPLCSECVVQTPDGIFCGEACFLGLSPSGSGEGGGAAAGPERSHRRAWPLVAVGVLVLAAIVTAVYLRPSEALKRAKRLKAKVFELDQNTDDAIVADLARAAAKKAIKAREEAERRVRELEREVKRLQLGRKPWQDKLDRTERILKENDRLKREARAREQYIVTLESKLGRGKVYRPVGR